MNEEYSRWRAFLKGRLWEFLLLLYAGLVFYYSVRPIEEGVPVIGLPGMDKVAHAGEFGLFALIAYPALRGYTGRKRGLAVTALISVVYGSVTEFTQLFIPYRTASSLDWLANAAGIAIALALLVFYEKSR